MTRSTLLAALARRIDRIEADHPVRVAIDGPDAAGKTTLADELVAPLRALGRCVLRASIDDFHRPARARYARGRESAEGYYRDSFDLDALREHLLDPLGPGGARRCRRRVFDYRRDAPSEAPVETPPADAVLLLDGVFLQCPRLEGCFELTLFVDVPPETALSRMVARDGAPAEPDHPRNRRYLGGQQLYLRERGPRERADVVIDNRDPAAPRILVERSA